MDKANIQQTTGLQVFYNENENVNVRTQVINDEPWFVAKDVAMALNVTWSSHTLDNIPEDWKGVVNLTTPSSGTRGGGLQTLKVINEAAVYKLAFRSNKPEADRFVNWVTGTVLPSIRRTGSYSVSNNRPESTKRLRKREALHQPCGALPYSREAACHAGACAEGVCRNRDELPRG